MYGEKAPSLPQKTFLVVNHLIALAGMAWLLFGGRIGRSVHVGADPPATCPAASC